MITNILFDFFGTLVDYSESRMLTEINTSYEYLCSLGFAIDKEKYLKEFDECFMHLEDRSIKNRSEFHMHELGRYFFEKCFQYKIPDAENSVFISKYINDWNIKTVYYEAIRPFLQTLHNKYRLSILSNTHYPELIHGNLANMGIGGMFHKVYTSVEIGIRKPNKEIFEHALKDLHIRADQAVYVGDSYNEDYYGSKTAGMKCYLIDKNGKYDRTIDTRLNNVFELLDKEI